MKIYCAIIFILLHFQLNAQSPVGLRMAVNCSYARMGDKEENALILSGTSPGISLFIEKQNIFNIKNVDAGLGYKLNGHSYRIFNYFEQEKIMAYVFRDYFSTEIFYNLKLNILLDKKYKKTNISFKPGVWLGINFKSSNTYNNYPKNRLNPIMKPIDCGLALCISMNKYTGKNRKTRFTMDLRYYHGLIDISKDFHTHDIWNTRSIEIGIYYYFKKKRK